MSAAAAAVPAGEGWITAGNNSEFVIPNRLRKKNMGVCYRTKGSNDVLSNFVSQLGCREEKPSKWKTRRSNFADKFQNAKHCLTRRISELGKYDAPVTPENREKRKSHIYPIKIAYTLGRNCLRKYTTRKNAVDLFTNSVNRRLASLGKNNILTNAEYGLAPSIARHIDEAPLKRIYNKNYGFATEDAWESEFASRLATLNDRVVATRTTPESTESFDNHESANAGTKRNKKPKKATPASKSANWSREEEDLLAKAQAEAIKASEEARAKAIKASEEASAKAIKASEEARAKAIKASEEAIKALEELGRKKIATASFYSENFILFESLSLFYYELRTIDLKSLSEESQNRLSELVRKNIQLGHSYVALNKGMDHLGLVNVKETHVKYNVKDVFPLLKELQEDVETLDKSILSFLLETKICKSDKERTHRQDAILNDIKKQTEMNSKLFYRIKANANDYIKKDCYDELVKNIADFEPILNGFIGQNNNLVFLKAARPPAPTPDMKIDTFPEFKDFYRRHLAIIAKC